MNAQTPHTDPLTQAAIQNGAVLRAVAAATSPLMAPVDIAHAAGVPPKNIARTVASLTTDGLLQSGEREGFTLTAAGQRALQAIDVWEGRAEVGGGEGGAADPLDLLLVHAQILPNPYNARRRNYDDGPDREALDQLKAQIVATGDLLQNLVVFPTLGPDVSPRPYMLAAGERRWRAVGELISEGLWEAERPLRCRLRDTGTAETSFIALVENSQNPLTNIEQARAYLDLTEDTGWSAREAALKTGRDPRTVQEMLRILRKADPAHIDAHEAGDPAWRWEQLRDSVKERAEPQPEGPAQGDIEEVGFDLELDDHARGRIPTIFPACEKLSPRHLMVVVEIADKMFRDPAPEQPGYVRIGENHPDPMHAHDALMSIGAGGLYTSEGHFWHVGKAALEWLRRNGLLTVAGDRDEILARVRRAGTSSEKAITAERSGTYVTPWLDPDYKIQAKAAADDDADPLTPTQRRILREIAARSLHRHRLLDGFVEAQRAALSDPDFGVLYDLAMVTRREAGDHVDLALTLSGRDHLKSHDQAPKDGLSRNSCTTPWLREPAPGAAQTGPIIGGGASQAKPPGPAREPVAPDAELTPVERVAMIELAHKLWTSPDIKDGEGVALVRVHQYWLDQAVSALQGKGLIVIMHGVAGGPFIGMPAAGRAWIVAHWPNQIGPIDLETERANLPGGSPHTAPGEYVTPWLNVPVQAENRAASAPPTPKPATPQARDAVELTDEDADANLVTGVCDLVTSHLFRIEDAAERWNRPTLSADQLAADAWAFLGFGSAVEAIVAIGGLIEREGEDRAEELLRANRPKAPAARDALLELRVGDLVHKGTSSTAYRLLEREPDREGHHNSGRQMTVFRAQTVRNGKDHGKPVTITLMDVYGLVKGER